MYACSADPSLSDFRSWLHSGPLWWEAINQNKALAVWWKMSWVCWGGAIYRPVGIYYRGWDRRGRVADTPEHWAGKNSPGGEGHDEGCSRRTRMRTPEQQLCKQPPALEGFQLALCLQSTMLADRQPSLPKATVPHTFLEVLQWCSSKHYHCKYIPDQWTGLHISVSPPLFHSKFRGLCSSHLCVPLLISLRCFRSVKAERGRPWKLDSGAREIIWRCSLGVQ